jgi:hypothetical protein
MPLVHRNHLKSQDLNFTTAEDGLGHSTFPIFSGTCMVVDSQKFTFFAINRLAVVRLPLSPRKRESVHLQMPDQIRQDDTIPP